MKYADIFVLMKSSLVGEWMNNSAGIAFAPHVITIGVGEVCCVFIGFPLQDINYDVETYCPHQYDAMKNLGLNVLYDG